MNQILKLGLEMYKATKRSVKEVFVDRKEET